MNFHKAGWTHKIYLNNSPTKCTTHSLLQQVCCWDILWFSYLLCFLLSFREASSLEDSALGYCNQHRECWFIDALISSQESVPQNIIPQYFKKATFVMWLPDLVDIHTCALLLTWVPGEKIWCSSMTCQIYLLLTWYNPTSFSIFFFLAGAFLISNAFKKDKYKIFCLSWKILVEYVSTLALGNHNIYLIYKMKINMMFFW